MRCSALLFVAMLSAGASLAAPCGAEEAKDGWVEPMRKVHDRFRGTPGTFAHFGDSMTVTLAFWSPLGYEPKGLDAAAAKALICVKARQHADCWSKWKGADYGNEGGMTIRWAHENVERWLKKLNPEVVLLMFGTNDLTQLDEKEYTAKTREVVQRCLSNGSVVILSTIPPRSGLLDKSRRFAAAVRGLAGELHVPLVDYFGEVLRRRPDDWDGSLAKFKDSPGDEYQVPTLIARDGVHPSNPKLYQSYDEEGLKHNGYSLRNYLVLRAYGEFIDKVLSPRGTNKPSQSNWPTWRGPHGTGVSDERGLPLKWSATENVRWKVPLPGPGNSTPVIWGDRIFLTQALDSGKRRAVLALARADGKQLWQQEVPCATTETTHGQNPPCTASPVTDGTAVYADFASAGVVAYDLEGKRLWHRDLGPVLHKWGNGSSPVLYRDLVIAFHGPGEPAFLVAIDRRTGKTVWKKEETAINSPVFGSWSTPVIVRVSDHDELVMALPGDRIGGEGELKGYDPATGKELWRCRGLGNEIYAMPIISAAGDQVVGISGHNGPLMAVRPGGTGDVTASHRLWRQAEKNPQRVGSGVLHEGRLYLADAPGLVECLDAKTGEALWKERLVGNLWGSMLLADGRLYVTNLEGTTFVLSAGSRFEVLARNEIKEPTYAAPAMSGGEIFIRTHEKLYCIR